MLKNNKIKYLITSIIVLSIGLFIYFKIYIPKHTFKTITLQNKNISLEVNGLGYVDSENYYNISSIYPGRLINFNLKESQYINKNELIGKIDFVDLKDKIDELKYQKDKLLSDIKTLKVDKIIALTDYKYQKLLYSKNLFLYKRNNISKIDFKKIETNTKISKLKIDEIDKKINSLSKQILQISSSISGLNKKLSKYTILSPVNGFIIDKYVSNYQYLNPGQNIITIVNPKDIRIQVFIDTMLSKNVKIGDKVLIKLRSKDKYLQGYVEKFNLKNNKITYEREIYIKYNKIPKHFFIDEQANVKIITKNLKSSYVIPYSVLSFYNNKQGIWILKNNKSHFIPININNKTDKYIILSKSFINKNSFLLKSKIIIPNNKINLKEGIKIYEN